MLSIKRVRDFLIGIPLIGAILASIIGGALLNSKKEDASSITSSASYPNSKVANSPEGKGHSPMKIEDNRVIEDEESRSREAKRAPRETDIMG